MPSALRHSSTRSAALLVVPRVPPPCDASSPCVVAGRMNPSEGRGTPFPTGVTPTYYAGSDAFSYSETTGGSTAPIAPPGSPRTDSVQRASQIARPSSSVRAIRHTCTVRPTLMGVASAVRWPSRTERRWLALSSIPTTLRPGPAARAAPRAGRRLGEEGRDAAVEDPVGLVDPPVHRDAQDDAVRAGLEELDVEQVVDALAATSECRGVAAWDGRVVWSPPDVNGAPIA